ncbi:PREDICTED: probable cytochrome P450 305a1 [Polistes canadensis]|uniref:probable cytochrome P450 305a1 n=1 Tax=Polistes canadensis TaxID=91411 RepID=UPI0007190374|nr:PREDICTED: probable cytochrome P450 305a1 [Polistes canadensis]
MYISVLLWTITILLIIFEYMQRWNQKKYPPGPFSWPLIGNQSILKGFVRKHGSQHVAFWKLAQKYKSDVIMLDLGMRNIVVVVSGAKTVHKLLRNHNFDGRPWNEFIKLRNMGIRKGITMNDGDEWKEIRSWVVRMLKTLGYGKQEMSKLIQDEIVTIVESLKNGGIYRLKPIITPAVLNVLWTFTTGKRISDFEKLQYFIGLMERRSRTFDLAGGILSTFPWIRYIAPEISGYNLLINVNNELKHILTNTINDHKENYVPGKENDLIDMFLREMYNEKESNRNFTDDQLLLILVDLFIAGINTTATTLDFLLLHMVVYQDVQKKVKEEISSKIGLTEFPKLEDKSKLDYVEAVITEAQRICGIIPLAGPRRVFEDTIFEDYTIPKNASILINQYSVHMDPDIYPNPHEFKPERFLKDGTFKMDPNLTLFGKGNRRCPGEKLAKSAIFLLFVGIMQKYTLLPIQDKGPYVIEIIPGLTLSPKPYEVLVVPQ